MQTSRSLTVLVLGGSGFVGSHVVDRLGRTGHRVVATTTGQRSPSASPGTVRWIHWNGQRQALPDVEFDRLNAVIHLAKPAAPFDFPNNAAAMYELSVAATFRLLEAARLSQVERVVLASTGDVLGPGLSPAQEMDACYRPQSFYAACKASAELLAASYEPLLSTAVLRFYHPYGPGGDRFLVNRLIRLVRDGREVRLDGPNGILLNPVWVEDLAEGVCRAIESHRQGVFHLAGVQTVSLRELVEMIGQLVGRPPVLRVGPGTAADQHTGHLERARRLLGYHPKVALLEGLGRVVENVLEAAK